MPECSDGVDDMFPPHPWDAKKFAKRCLQRFGVSPDPERLRVLYGGSDISSVSNLIFTYDKLPSSALEKVLKFQLPIN